VWLLQLAQALFEMAQHAASAPRRNAT